MEQKEVIETIFRNLAGEAAVISVQRSLVHHLTEAFVDMGCSPTWAARAFVSSHADWRYVECMPSYVCLMPQDGGALTVHVSDSCHVDGMKSFRLPLRHLCHLTRGTGVLDMAVVGQATCGPDSWNVHAGMFRVTVGCQQWGYEDVHRLWDLNVRHATGASLLSRVKKLVGVSDPFFRVDNGSSYPTPVSGLCLDGSVLLSYGRSQFRVVPAVVKAAIARSHPPEPFPLDWITE